MQKKRIKYCTYRKIFSFSHEEQFRLNAQRYNVHIIDNNGYLFYRHLSYNSKRIREMKNSRYSILSSRSNYPPPPLSLSLYMFESFYTSTHTIWQRMQPRKRNAHAYITVERADKCRWRATSVEEVFTFWQWVQNLADLNTRTQEEKEESTSPKVLRPQLAITQIRLLPFHSFPFHLHIYIRVRSLWKTILCAFTRYIHTYFLLSACNRGILIRSFVAPRSRKRVSRETSMNQVTTIVIDNWPRKVWCLVNERLR